MIKHNRRELVPLYAGLSSETKPTGASVECGAQLYEFDTQKSYTYDAENAQWAEGSPFEPGQGGGLPEGLEQIYYGTYIPATDVPEIQFAHNLGTDNPLVATIWVKDGTNVPMTDDLMLWNVYVRTNVPQRYNGTGASAVAAPYGYVVSGVGSPSYGENGMASVSVPSTSSYLPVPIDANTYAFRRSASTRKFKAGVEYSILIIKGV